MTKEEKYLASLSAQCIDLGREATEALRFGANTAKHNQPCYTNGLAIAYEFERLKYIIGKLQEDNMIPILPEVKAKAIQSNTKYILEEYMKDM